MDMQARNMLKLIRIVAAYLLVGLLTFIPTLPAKGQTGSSKYDEGKPFGFCTRSSRTSSSSTFNITGGGGYIYDNGTVKDGSGTAVASTKVKVLKSTGKDMKTTIMDAIKNAAYSVIIFDGSEGDFIISSTMSFSSLKNKTILGINNARLCTTWYATPEIIKALNDAGVPGMSTSSGTGGTLSNGSSVSEQAEYMTRQIIINLTGDTKESYRSSGIFYFSGCDNFIIRNLKLQGPGSIDVSGSDLMSLYGSTHFWVDHCDFTDGMDGNFDITQKANFNTVSWCTFSYTDRAYMHQNTNLVGSSDSETVNYLNTTFAFNNWGKGCRARMPMARVGKIHMLNNYYTCTGNGTPCINPRKNSEFLIEGNYFDASVVNFFSQSDAIAYVWKNTNVIACGKSAPSSSGSVTVPYTYTVAPANDLPTEVAPYVGATLFGEGYNPPSPPGGPTEEEEEKKDEDVNPDVSNGNTYIVAKNETTYDGRKVECKDITMTYGNGASWYAAVDDVSAPTGYTSYISGTVNPVDGNGKRYDSSGKVPTKGTYFVFNPTKDGVLSVAVEIFTGKQLYVTEDGTAINVTANGNTITPGGVVNASAPYYGTLTFSVSAGKTYHLFCISSKIMLFGFAFEPKTTTPAPDPKPDPDPDPDPEPDPIVADGDVVIIDKATEPNVPATQGTALTFEETARYSQLAINSRLNSFYANTSKIGFGTFNDQGEKTAAEFGTSSNLDYVPGLVAKAVIEAVDYYKSNSKVNVKPWYYAIQYYGNKYDISSNGKNGKNFDDLNAVKLYADLKQLAASKAFADGKDYTNAATVTTASARMTAALEGIRKADAGYSIHVSGMTDAEGGWWHKSSYVNQMWCDGQYMGPALLAQLMNTCPDYKAIAADGSDWDLITKQFSICWKYLWDADKELLYHAFSATPTDSYAKAWADPATYHSQEYWGRAVGWYILALVDVLEEMQKAGQKGSENYNTLRTYLNKVAAGLAKRADSKTGCWYQLLQYDDTFYADSYQGSSKTKTYNYLESSASALFIAAYLKGMRLSLYDTDYTAVAKKAYKGFVETFLVSDGNGGIHIVNSCRSAGLGGSSNRDGSAAYYLLGSDVTRVTTSMKQTEGKVLGAFILAATEYERAFLCQQYPKGDVNKDGAVTMTDANIVVNHYLGNGDAVIETSLGDMDNDNSITMTDANSIVNKYLMK